MELHRQAVCARPPGPSPSAGSSAITGSAATVELTARAPGGGNATVGKFLAVMTAKSLIVGLITEIGEQPLAPAGAGQTFRKVAQIDLIGEIRDRSGVARFERGVSEYPEYRRRRDPC